VRRLAFLLLFAGGAGADDVLDALFAELDAEVVARREGGAGGEADALAAEVEALRSRAAEAAAPPATKVPEMHIVYAGEGSLTAGQRARVRVTARSRPIVLALGSTGRVRWHVDAEPGAEVRRVVTLGSADSLVVAPPQVPVETLAERADFPFDDGAGREALVRAVEEASGYVVWTLLAVETPDPAQAIVVGPGNPEWSAQQLRTGARLLLWRETRGRRAALREDLKALRFGALYRWREASKPQQLHVAFGEWTPLGPLLRRQTVLPDMVAAATAVACDAERGHVYLLCRGSLQRFTLPSWTPEVLHVPDTLPEVRERCALAVDTRRNRLLLATKHDHGYLYAMDLKSREWSVLSDMDDVDAAGMAYDEQRDAVLCLEYGEAGAVKLHRFSPEDGRHQRETPLRLPRMPGKRTFTVACRKGLLVILDPPPFAHRDADQSCVFVVEPHSGEVLFASRTRPWEDFRRLDDARLDALWGDLAVREGADAGRAMRELAGQGDRAVAFLARRFTPDERAPEELGRWVELLAADDALVRDLAHFRLVEAGPRAEAFLAGLDPAELQPEARRRVIAALGEVGGNQRLPRYSRAIQVLEWIETPDAAKLLEELGAGGDPRRRALANGALARIDRPRH